MMQLVMIELSRAKRGDRLSIVGGRLLVVRPPDQPATVRNRWEEPIGEIELNLSRSRRNTMTTQQVTIELPEPVFRQLVRIAEATQQSVAALIAQSVVSNLPPSVENAPLEMQAELMQMQTLSIEELLVIAQATVDSGQHERHVNLLEKHQDGLLTLTERQELTDLRLAADGLMLRKAYAWSILRWRGHRVPLLKDLVAPL
jgi:predicted transcriptional regulator